MKLGRRSLSRLTLPLKALLDRFAFAAFLLLSLALLLVGKADHALLGRVGAGVSDAMVPVLVAVVEPVNAARRAASQIGRLFALRQENAQLRAQNQRLLEWQDTARQLALENGALRQLLNLESGAPPPIAVTARVVADAGSPFVHTVLVDAGAEQGVVKGMAAINERGLVGRVIEVGRRSARVLLLTDFNSRVPVMVEPSRDQAILAGDNSREPGLTFLPLNPRMAVGQRVVTSGRGGVLPPGLAVGRISAIDDRKVAVAPEVDWQRLEYVRLLEYSRVVPPESLAALQREVYGPPRPPAAATGEPAAQAEGTPGTAGGHP
ncbi:MAG TPA: rod shape-determining protein MreC [Geminicoccaceae bacterium]|nr:rod shape-determining protein MreC [Geminicoccaceae bacterium]